MVRFSYFFFFFISLRPLPVSQLWVLPVTAILQALPWGIAILKWCRMGYCRIGSVNPKLAIISRVSKSLVLSEQLSRTTHMLAGTSSDVIFLPS